MNKAVYSPVEGNYVPLNAVADPVLSFYYQRLITHLKYLVFRIFKQEQTDSETDDFFYRISRIQYPRIHRCVNIIDEYMNYNYNIHMSTEEMGYLVIHLSALLKRKNMK